MAITIPLISRAENPMITVLYVDDEPDLLEIGKLFLESSGDFHVDTETSARAALAALGQARYDAIVSDYLIRKWTASRSSGR